MLPRTMWGAGSALALVGTFAIVRTFESHRVFNLGVALLLIGCTAACTGLVCTRSRTLDEEFQAGYRLGHRAGRKVGLVSTVSPIHRQSGGLGDFNRQVKHGRIPKAPVGTMASNGADAGRFEAYQD